MQLFVPMAFYLPANSCKSLIARNFLWRCGIVKFVFCKKPKSQENPVTNACGIQLLANSYKSLISRDSLWRCGIDNFDFCKEPKVREIRCKSLWHSVLCMVLGIFHAAQIILALWHCKFCRSCKSCKFFNFPNLANLANLANFATFANF